MGKKTVLYRGNLKSCNYRCTYCPFSKHKASAAELEKDRLNFQRFCDSVVIRARAFSIGAVFIVPYGEASLYRWYWEGMGRLAGIPEIDRVGIQTNLSFSVEECLNVFDLYSGDGYENNYSQGAVHRHCDPTQRREKLCIWATFHPEMTDADTFAAKCRRLTESGVMLCAGAVGVPQNISLLGSLREKLSPDIYLWINKMDGLGRKYTPEEREAFSAIDPFFEYEFRNPAADAGMCGDRCFVEADGRVHACNISAAKETGWYEGSEEEIFRPLCRRKRCTCYLAYGGRFDFEGRQFFGDYPVFRIPRRFRAVFLDLEGTLVPEGDRGGFSENIRGKLQALGKTAPIFLATSMPLEEAAKRVKGDMELFQGGVFASGALVVWRGDGDGRGKCGREAVYPVDIGKMPELVEFAADSGARIQVYRKNDVPYKVTVIKRRNRVWGDAECGRMAVILEGSDCRFFTEGNCLEIVGRSRDKGTGIEEICSWMGIGPEDVLAVGNDREDAAMERVCGAFSKGIFL